MSHSIMLAIETSQRMGGVAVRDRTGEVHAERLGEGSRYDDDLMPAIDAVVKRAGLTPRDLEAVGVSIGPGGFTGLRIAIAAAKAMGLALGVPLLAVPSALVAAAGSDIGEFARPGAQILVALASKRNSYWGTVVYIHEEFGWRTDHESRLMVAGERMESVHAVLADRYFPDEARSQYEQAGIPIFEPRFDPAACLRVADRLSLSGQVVDPLALKPIYPRPPEAVALWSHRQGEPNRVQ